MSANKIERIDHNGQTVIRKRIAAAHEWHVHQHFLQRQVRVPALLGVEEGEAGGLRILMEDVAGEHLELHPDRYEQAFEGLLQLRALPFVTAVQPITTEKLLLDLQNGPHLTKVGKALGWERERLLCLLDVWNWVREYGTFGEPVVFSHGDYHPQNLLVAEGQVIPIDFEKTGMHSVFQDLYALLHMSYPNRKSCLTAERQAQLFAKFAERLGLQEMQAGYETFRLLNRLCELVQISVDLQMGRRESAGLYAQAEAVYDDLLEHAH